MDKWDIITPIVITCALALLGWIGRAIKNELVKGNLALQAKVDGLSEQMKDNKQLTMLGLKSNIAISQSVITLATACKNNGKINGELTSLIEVNESVQGEIRDTVFR